MLAGSGSSGSFASHSLTGVVSTESLASATEQLDSGANRQSYVRLAHRRGCTKVEMATSRTNVRPEAAASSIEFAMMRSCDPMPDVYFVGVNM